MSETESTKSQDVTVDTPKVDKPAKPAKPAKARTSGNGGGALASLALLVGLAGAGAGGWSLWQLHQIQGQEQQQRETLTTALETDNNRIEQLSQRLDQRLASLPSAGEIDDQRRLLGNLQSDQQRLSQRMEDVVGASRQEWRLAEAEHLLRLAVLRLSAMQDVQSAEALVTATDDILRNQNDPSAFAAREQLSRSLEALRTTPHPDRAGLFLQLAALREQAADLKPLAPEFNGKDDVLSQLGAEGEMDESKRSWWRNWASTLGEYVRIEFNADQNIRPLLSGQSLMQVRLALSLALEQAQWGALHGQEKVYQQALAQAGQILDDHFNLDDPKAKALRQRFTDLAKKPVAAPMPDLTESLDAVQAYIERKQAQRRGAPAVPAAETAEEQQ